MNTLPPIVFRQGKKVQLRPVEQTDIPGILRWMNNPEILKFIDRYLPTSDAHQQAWFERVTKQSTTDVTLAIVVEQQMIGCVGIHNVNMRDRTATAGIVIGLPEYHEKGYGTDAIMTMLSFAFLDMNIRKICAAVWEYNPRSLACLKKCGFFEEGRRKKQRFHDGEYWDEHIVGLTYEEWLPFWNLYTA